MDHTINNASALLQECLHNGDKSLVDLRAWFLGKRYLIKATIEELDEIALQQQDPSDKVLRKLEMFKKTRDEGYLDKAISLLKDMA